MNTSICKKLTELKRITQDTSETDVPTWIREMIVSNVMELLDADTTNHKVANELVGGLRAISDASPAGDDDPIVSQILAIVNEIESGKG